MNQLSIDFAPPSLERARLLRDEAMLRVAAKAEEAAPTFAARAYAFLIRYAAAHPEFGGEDATEAIKAAGIVPHDDRAFGPIYAKAARNGLIRRIGFVPRRRGHGSPGPLWSACR